MARQSYGCVRNCIPEMTGDTALTQADRGVLVSLTSDGFYEYGEPGVEKTPISGDPTIYGVEINFDEGAGKCSVSLDGLVIVKKEANAVETDAGKGITPSTTIAGHAAVADTGGFYQIVAIESTESPNLLVDLSAPNPAASSG